ncbi:MAG: aminodeoxychorismate synthase component I [Rhodospirillales bacterium]|nr:aminodeoxychorismate synthase component I [Rhodospirillales bacterium]MCB9995098.1 aminodeoxychorismate synthase component I [Rhodospirillales bacterium]
MKLYSFTFYDAAPHDLFAALARQPYSLFFDSADASHELNRYSFIAFQPIETIESKDGKITVTNREQQLSFFGNPFDALKDRLETYGLDRESKDEWPPFQGGAAGFFGYDLGRSLEKLPEFTRPHPDMPDMAVGIYDHVYAYDHQKEKGWFLIHAEDEQQAEARYQQFTQLTSPPHPNPPPAGGRDEKGWRSNAEPYPQLGGGDTDAGQWHASHSKDEYERAVQRVIDYIYAGDIFQANLSQRFEATLPAGFDAYSHYKTLRRVNAAPFAGFMNFGNVRIASASPERFLFCKDRKVETRPIKGTAKRDANDTVDRIYRNHLQNSAKDRAENMMIVDLLRNDLSKVCEDHSIEVPQLCKLESFAKVHHLVSIVKGTLRADQSPLDLLAGSFPGGSITGAPKVRAMEIIEELETVRRGPYCGAMGYIGYNGTMDTNIAIRTLVYDGNSVSFNAGGGIVADSNPSAEYEETLAKAEAIFGSFETTESTEFEKRAQSQ